MFGIAPRVSPICIFMILVMFKHPGVIFSAHLIRMILEKADAKRISSPLHSEKGHDCRGQALSGSSNVKKCSAAFLSNPGSEERFKNLRLDGASQLALAYWLGCPVLHIVYHVNVPKICTKTLFAIQSATTARYDALKLALSYPFLFSHHQAGR